MHLSELRTEPYPVDIVQTEIYGEYKTSLSSQDSNLNNMNVGLSSSPIGPQALPSPDPHFKLGVSFSQKI